MNSARIKECTELSAEILKNFELSEIPVSNIILKCLRLCRLLGDEEGILLFTYESSGYPQKLTAEPWRIAKLAGRTYWGTKKDELGKDVDCEFAKTELVAVMEETIDAQKIRLAAASDPNVSISSANPHQYVSAPSRNSSERVSIVTSITSLENTSQKIRGCLYNYILKIYNKLSYGNIVEEVFTQARITSNNKLAELCPQAIGKFVAVYNNMDSDNAEDWANAVHSCRRILVDLADALFPAQNEPLEVGGKMIRVGPEQYVNRIIQFISGRSTSKTYKDIVGSDLSSIGKRLDAINDAACKGTHDEITKDEASRYIIHTYLLIGDIVALLD